MRFFFVSSVLAAFAIADESCDQREEVSMLQTRDRSALKEPADLIQAVTAVAQKFGSDAEVENFLDGVKVAAKDLQAADGKEALLQRASQSENMQNLISRFQALPDQDREKLTVAGGAIFDQLPAPQRSALVQQVSHALDDSVDGKPKTETKTDKTTGAKTTVTHDKQTGYYHRHTHSSKGTESVSQGKKGGHRHEHSYRHDGKGGNARTRTFSKGLTGHEHGHSHSHSHVNGVTHTNTNTRTKSVDGAVHQHHHDHTHHPDVGTSTNTGTFSSDGKGRSSGHTHSHGHNERNGNSDTHSNSAENGVRTWHHGHHHDVASGTWVSEGNEGHHGHWHNVGHVGHGGANHHGGHHGGHHDWDDDDHDDHHHR